MAVSTVEYAEQHIAKHMPLKMAGTYVPQTKAQTDGIAAGTETITPCVPTKLSELHLS